jgi:hypothetical protein
MPVEINELVIRASVGSDAPPTLNTAASGTGNDQPQIQKMLDEVLKKLKEKEER